MHHTDKNFVPSHQQLITKQCHLFSIELVLFQFGCHDNYENLLIVISSMPSWLCEKFKSFGITNHKEMADCFFLHYEVSNNDGTDSIVLHFLCWHWEKQYYHFLLADLNFRASYLENGLADFSDTYTWWPKKHSCLIKHNKRGFKKNEICFDCQWAYLNFDILVLILVVIWLRYECLKSQKRSKMRHMRSTIIDNGRSSKQIFIGVSLFLGKVKDGFDSN